MVSRSDQTDSDSPDNPSAAKAADPARHGYHHGNLRQALIDATVELIAVRGLDQVTLREVARIVGVSSGAPFRHFPSRVALLTAIAEEAMDRLVCQVDQALSAAAADTPLLQYRAIGLGFLRWAIGNPVHFQVISARAVIDFEGSSLRRRNDALRSRMHQLMMAAWNDGLLRFDDVTRQEIAGRALAYGLARMYVDGQFPSWGLDDGQAVEEAVAIFDRFIASIAR